MAVLMVPVHWEENEKYWIEEKPLLGCGDEASRMTAFEGAMLAHFALLPG